MQLTKGDERKLIPLENEFPTPLAADDGTVAKAGRALVKMGRLIGGSLSKAWHAGANVLASIDTLGVTSEALDRITAQKGFISSKEHPSPSSISGNELDDLAAVIAGSKPAAFIDFQGGLHFAALIRIAKKSGLEIDVLESQTRDGLLRSYVVGSRKRVDEIKTVNDELFASEQPPSPALHRKMGELLGYHPDAIEEYAKLQDARDVAAIHAYVKRTWKGTYPDDVVLTPVDKKKAR